MTRMTLITSAAILFSAPFAMAGYQSISRSAIGTGSTPQQACSLAEFNARGGVFCNGSLTPQGCFSNPQKIRDNLYNCNTNCTWQCYTAGNWSLEDIESGENH